MGETRDSRLPRGEVDTAKFEAFVAAIRASDRAKDSVKEKSPDELDCKSWFAKICAATLIQKSAK